MNFNHNFNAAAADRPFMDEMLTVCLLALFLFSVYNLLRFYWGSYSKNGAGLTAILSGLTFVIFSVYFFSSIEGPRVWLGFLFSLLLAVSVFHPALALANATAFLIIRPWELQPLESSYGILPRGFFVIFLVSFLLHILRTGILKLKWDRSVVLLLALLGWVFLSTFITGRVAESQSEFFANYFRSVVVGVLILMGVHSRDDNKGLQGAIVIAVLGLSVFALLNTYALGADRLEGRGAIQNANDLAAVLIMVVPLALSGVFQKGHSWHKWILPALLLVILGVGAYTAQSRAAYLALLCMGLTWVLIRSKNRQGLVLKLLVVGFIAAAALSQISLGRDSSDLQESQMNRLGYWKAGVSMTLRNPVLGVGFGEFANNYNRYGAADFTETGKRTAHSSWILLMSETGLIGLGLMLTFVFLVIRKAWRVSRERPEFILSLVGYGVCMSFLSHIYTLYPYVLAGLILSYPESQKESEI